MPGTRGQHVIDLNEALGKPDPRSGSAEPRRAVVLTPTDITSLYHETTGPKRAPDE